MVSLRTESPEFMNATVSPLHLQNAEETTDPRNRRGPFRPERLVSTRERRGRELSVRLFRTADMLALLALAGFALAPLTHDLVAPRGFLIGLSHLAFGDFLPFVAVAVVAWLALRGFGLYRFERSESLLKHLTKVTLLLAGTFAAGWGLARMAPDPFAVSSAIEAWAALSLAVFASLHLMWWSIVSRWRRQGRLTPNIIVVGATRHAEKLIEAAIAARDVNVLGVFDDRMSRVADSVAGVPVLGDVNDLLSHKITPYVDQIVVAIDTGAKARVKSIIDRLRALPNEVLLVVDVENDDDRQAALSRMADVPLAQVSGISEDERKEMFKRVQDVVLGTIALFMFAPLMAVVAIAIKLESKGPVFFRQRRHGFNNEAIMVWKFRSMYTHMTDHTSAQQVTKGDPRVTRVGRIIRKTSIDELPQLFNVLIGEMSLVGPRPHAIGMKTGNEASERLVAEYAWRHRMKPGVTGWAAIHGSRGPMDTAEDVRRRVALDIDYVERQSLWLDLYIMAMTVPCLLGDKEATR